jgi:UDP-glucuronate decarboxylase
MRVSNRNRVLITGGAGFLGSHLSERLINEGCDVLCLDNFYSGTKENVAHLLANPHFELMRHDVTFPLYVEVDEIYNLACPASPVHYSNGKSVCQSRCVGSKFRRDRQYAVE